MRMMTSQILKSVHFTKKHKNLENEKLFFPQIKNLLITHQGLYIMAKNSFVAEVTCNISFVSTLTDIIFY